MEYNVGKDFKNELYKEEFDLGEGKKKSKAWKYITKAAGGLVALALLCSVSGCDRGSKAEYKGVKEKPAVTEMVKKDKENPEFGLGADIMKYVIGETPVFYVYRSPIGGWKGFFSKKRPKGYVGYINPDTGAMGWVPKDIEIPEGYVLDFDRFTGRVIGKSKKSGPPMVVPAKVPEPSTSDEKQ